MRRVSLLFVDILLECKRSREQGKLPKMERPQFPFLAPHFLHVQHTMQVSGEQTPFLTFGL
jgi:hypothetical protein